MTSHATNQVVSDKVVRERTFEVLTNRADKKDALGQVAITLQQLLEDNNFIGKIEINCTCGRVNSIKVIETKRA